MGCLDVDVDGLGRRNGPPSMRPPAVGATVFNISQEKKRKASKHEEDAAGREGKFCSQEGKGRDE